MWPAALARTADHALIPFDKRNSIMRSRLRVRRIPEPDPTPVASTFSIQRALLATVGLAILAGMIPAGVALDRRLADALQARAREDLSLAPRVLADRNVANADMMMMHAKDFAHLDGLADALARNDRAATLIVVDRAKYSPGQSAIVIGPDGKSWTGPVVTDSLIGATRSGKMPVIVQREGDSIRNVALAPVLRDGKWVGAAGLLSPIDESTAGVLSGLTRSGVLILSGADKMVAASTMDTTVTREIIAAIRQHGPSLSNVPYEILTGNDRRLIVSAPLGDASEVVFTRARSEELAVLPELRRGALFFGHRCVDCCTAARRLVRRASVTASTPTLRGRAGHDRRCL